MFGWLLMCGVLLWCRIGTDVDESELEAELAGLEDEWAAEEDSVAAETEQTPSYLAPAARHDLPAAPSGGLANPTRRTTDEFGLPIASST